jgi:hypothetical protein
MHNPGTTHITGLKRLLRYARATADHGLKYDFSPTAQATLKPNIYGYYDASHADCPDTMRSTMAYVFFFAGCPISWQSKLHTFVTTSTNHSEYCAASKAAREAKWLETMWQQIGFGQFVSPVNLYSDSQGAIAMAYNPVQRSTTKHVDPADHYVREQQERGTVVISYVTTKDIMIADALTKALPSEGFNRHTSKLISQVAL